MGCGAWTTSAAKGYYEARGIDADDISARNVSQFYKAEKMDASLDPFKVTRECCDSEEHPNTIPIILALDVTGSMSSALAGVAKKLNEIMTSSLSEFKDVEFCIMGIGDLAYDDAPIQMSQYESDIRILESLDKVYFERGGGGNNFESYSAAWYMGLYHTKLDCWKRGRKGIIITLGDEVMNPYLPKKSLSNVTGDHLQDSVDTFELYNDAKEKFDIYHISITDPGTSFRYREKEIRNSFSSLLGQNYMESDSEALPNLIKQIIQDAEQKNGNNFAAFVSEDPVGETVENNFTFGEEISW